MVRTTTMDTHNIQHNTQTNNTEITIYF
jgi:hypothetical protein